MADQDGKHPLNVDGGFYVDHSLCANHESCVYFAPNHFRIDPGDHYGAYVFNQPNTPEEVAECQRAMDGCPAKAIRING
jgi:ferredoxin